MTNTQIVVIGISGVTCGGKTTTATELCNTLPNSKMFCQDDYYLPVEDPRHTWIPELNHINFDILSSLDMENMTEDVLKYINEYKNTEQCRNGPEYQNTEITHPEPAHCDLKLKCDNEIRTRNVHLVIVEGFCIFNHKPLAELIDLMYYFTLNRDVCFQRREKRVYEPPDCPGYFDLCVWPEYLNQLQEVRETVKNVTYFNESTKNPVEKILKDILGLLKK